MIAERCVMESGAIILEGPTADVAYNPDVINIYLGIRTASSVAEARSPDNPRFTTSRR